MVVNTPYRRAELLVAREAGRYLLRATNTGTSAVINQRGRMLARSPQFQPHTLSARVIPHRGLTPYAAMGNYRVLRLIEVESPNLGGIGEGPCALEVQGEIHG